MKKFHGHLAHLIHKVMKGKWELSRCLELARLCDPRDVCPLIDDLKEELRNPQPDYEEIYGSKGHNGPPTKPIKSISLADLI